MASNLVDISTPPLKKMNLRRTGVPEAVRCLPGGAYASLDLVAGAALRTDLSAVDLQAVCFCRTTTGIACDTQVGRWKAFPCKTVISIRCGSERHYCSNDASRTKNNLEIVYLYMMLKK